MAVNQILSEEIPQLHAFSQVRLPATRTFRAAITSTRLRDDKQY